MAAVAPPRDGLAILQEKRLEVLDSYLHLLGGLGRSLDPKVRQLLLLALQVSQGSERGLRHHVPRALAAGATVDEVIDAIALTLPVVGLTRVSEALAQVEDLLEPAPDA